jgi:DNA-binding transcriptional regulator YiaG
MSRATKGKEAKRPSRTERTLKHGDASKKPSSDRRSNVGAEILEAFEGVRNALNSGEPLDQHFTVRSYRFELTPREYGPEDPRSVRRILGLSQPLFAEFLGVDASTVRS